MGALDIFGSFGPIDSDKVENLTPQAAIDSLFSYINSSPDSLKEISSTVMAIALELKDLGYLNDEVKGLKIIQMLLSR